jgi:hypothetical protein
MRKSTALRILSLLPLLPAGLADFVCYDIASPMHPEILIPVENCWVYTPPSASSIVYMDKEKAGNPNPGNGPVPPPAPTPNTPKPGNDPAGSKSSPSPGNGKSNGNDNQNDDGNSKYNTYDESASYSASYSTSRTYITPTARPSGTSWQSQSTPTFINDDDNVNLPFFNFAPAAPLQEILDAPALPPPDWNSPNLIYFNIDCNEPAPICTEMTQTLNAAGWYISQVFAILISIDIDRPIQDSTYCQCIFH